MGNALQFDRVVAEVKRLCYAGLDSYRLRTEAMHALRPLLPFDLCCFDTVDPSTGLVTTTVQEGVTSRQIERTYLERVYFEDSLPDFRSMLQHSVPVACLSERTGGRLEQALRHQLLYKPLGLGDEIRAVFKSRQQMWGTLVMSRDRSDPFYTERHKMLLKRLAPHLGEGLRAATLRTLAIRPPTEDGSDVPGLIIYHPKGHVEHYTAAAERWLAELGALRPGWLRESVPPVVVHMAGAVRRALAIHTEAEEAAVPQFSVVGRSGRAITVMGHLMQSDDGVGRIGVIFEPASTRELIRFRTAAFGLSPREQSIVHLVARGASTQQIADQLRISPHTVQEHLTNIFDKVGVRSRREVVKQIFLTNLFGN